MSQHYSERLKQAFSECDVLQSRHAFRFKGCSAKKVRALPDVRTVYISQASGRLVELEKALEHALKRLSEQEKKATHLEQLLASIVEVKPHTAHTIAGAAEDRGILEILELTEAMFGSNPTIALLRDPELPERPFPVVTVKAKGNPTELIALRHEWHDRVANIFSGRSCDVRLSIIPE